MFCPSVVHMTCEQEIILVSFAVWGNSLSCLGLEGIWKKENYLHGPGRWQDFTLHCANHNGFSLTFVQSYPHRKGNA